MTLKRLIKGIINLPEPRHAFVTSGNYLLSLGTQGYIPNDRLMPLQDLEQTTIGSPQPNYIVSTARGYYFAVITTVNTNSVIITRRSRPQEFTLFVPKSEGFIRTDGSPNLGLRTEGNIPDTRLMSLEGLPLFPLQIPEMN
jgi:hypothetical protein